MNTPELELDITWDPAKAQTNFTKHKVTFEQAAMVFSDPFAMTVFDNAHSDDEERWFTLGTDSDGQLLLAVAHTHRATDTNHVHIRIISARKATHHERQQYEQHS